MYNRTGQKCTKCSKKCPNIKQVKVKVVTKTL